MPSRRSHTNSHHGCSECKSGRVKCDEQKPRCSLCQKRGKPCTYRHLQTDYDPFKNVTIGEERECTQTTSTTDEPYILAAPKCDVRPSTQHHLSDEADAALYDHYLQEISPLFSRRTRHETLPSWDEGVRLYALNNPHLYSIILAFSAAHRALTEPQDVDRKRYLALGLEHQTQALSLFYPVLSNPTAANYDAALVCSTIIVMCAMATPLAARSLQDGPFDVLEELTRAFALFEGMTQLYRISWRQDQPISVLIRSRILEFREHQAPCPDAEAALDEVADYVKAQEGLVANALYLNTIMHLKNVFQRLAVMPDNHSVVLMWPTAIWHATFLQRLEVREPLALILMAYWAASLHRVKHAFWIGSWGAWAMGAIHDALDEHWHRFLVWPEAQVAK